MQLLLGYFAYLTCRLQLLSLQKEFDVFRLFRAIIHLIRCFSGRCILGDHMVLIEKIYKCFIIVRELIAAHV